MNLSPITLQQLVKEIVPQVTRRLIRDAFILQNNALYLNLGEAGFLCCCAQPNRAHICFTEAPKVPQTDQPTWVTHHLVKSGITGIKAIPNERVVQLFLTNRDRYGSETLFLLTFEMMGRNPNLILSDAKTGKTFGALRHIKPKQDHAREILPGKTYTLPPPQKGVPASELTPEHVRKIHAENPDKPYQALKYLIQGLDDITALEMCHRFQIAESSSTKDHETQVKQIQDFLANPPTVAGAVVVTDPDNRRHITPLQITCTEPEKTCASTSEAIAYVLALEDFHGALKGQITNLEKDLATKLANNERKWARIREDLEEAQRSEEFEKFGNLLMAHLNDIPNDVHAFATTDMYAQTPIEITIPLDPNRSPLDNANDYIKRSQKAKKAYPILQERADKTQAEITELQSYIHNLQNVRSASELNRIQEELESKKLIKPRKKQKQKQNQRKRNPGDIHPRRYRTRDGWLVLVGRNNKENDKLTKSSARDDIFFHVHGSPGSHVILKQEGRGENPPRSTIKEAASLAAYWSKARSSRSAPVSYTEIRYVQKPKGAPPGLVTIRNEKSIMVEPCEINKEDDV